MFSFHWFLGIKLISLNSCPSSHCTLTAESTIEMKRCISILVEEFFNLKVKTLVERRVSRSPPLRRGLQVNLQAMLSGVILGNLRFQAVSA